LNAYRSINTLRGFASVTLHFGLGYAWDYSGLTVIRYNNCPYIPFFTADQGVGILNKKQPFVRPRKPVVSADISDYDELGVTTNHSLAEIKTAYRKLALRWHPDKAANNGNTKEESSAKFMKLTASYEKILNSCHDIFDERGIVAALILSDEVDKFLYNDEFFRFIANNRAFDVSFEQWMAQGMPKEKLEEKNMDFHHGAPNTTIAHAPISTVALDTNSLFAESTIARDINKIPPANYTKECMKERDTFLVRGTNRISPFNLSKLHLSGEEVGDFGVVDEESIRLKPHALNDSPKSSLSTIFKQHTSTSVVNEVDLHNNRVFEKLRFANQHIDLDAAVYNLKQDLIRYNDIELGIVSGIIVHNVDVAPQEIPVHNIDPPRDDGPLMQLDSQDRIVDVNASLTHTRTQSHPREPIIIVPEKSIEYSVGVPRVRYLNNGYERLDMEDDLEVVPVEKKQKTNCFQNLLRRKPVKVSPTVPILHNIDPNNGRRILTPQRSRANSISSSGRGHSVSSESATLPIIVEARDDGSISDCSMDASFDSQISIYLNHEPPRYPKYANWTSYRFQIPRNMPPEYFAMISEYTGKSNQTSMSQHVGLKTLDMYNYYMIVQRYGIDAIGHAKMRIVDIGGDFNVAYQNQWDFFFTISPVISDSDKLRRIEQRNAIRQRQQHLVVPNLCRCKVGLDRMCQHWFDYNIHNSNQLTKAYTPTMLLLKHSLYYPGVLDYVAQILKNKHAEFGKFLLHVFDPVKKGGQYPNNEAYWVRNGSDIEMWAVGNAFPYVHKDMFSELYYTDNCVYNSVRFAVSTRYQFEGCAMLVGTLVYTNEKQNSQLRDNTTLRQPVTSSVIDMQRNLGKCFLPDKTIFGQHAKMASTTQFSFGKYEQPESTKLAVDSHVDGVFFNPPAHKVYTEARSKMFTVYNGYIHTISNYNIIADGAEVEFRKQDVQKLVSLETLNRYTAECLGSITIDKLTRLSRNLLRNEVADIYDLEVLVIAIADEANRQNMSIVSIVNKPEIQAGNAMLKKVKSACCLFGPFVRCWLPIFLKCLLAGLITLAAAAFITFIIFSLFQIPFGDFEVYITKSWDAAADSFFTYLARASLNHALPDFLPSWPPVVATMEVPYNTLYSVALTCLNFFIWVSLLFKILRRVLSNRRLLVEVPQKFNKIRKCCVRDGYYSIYTDGNIANNVTFSESTIYDDLVVTRNKHNFQKILDLCDKDQDGENVGAFQISPVFQGEFSDFKPLMYHSCASTSWMAMLRQIGRVPLPNIDKDFDNYAQQILKELFKCHMPEFKRMYTKWFNHLTGPQQKNYGQFDTFITKPLPWHKVLLKNIYSLFVKQERQMCHSECPKNRCISNPDMVKKFIMGAVCYALEEFFAKYLSGYCGGKNTEEIAAFIEDAMALGFTKTIQGDASAYDSTQHLSSKESVDFFIYKVVAPYISHVPIDVFLRCATAPTATFKLERNKDPFFSFTQKGTVQSGNSDTTLMNTVRMVLYIRYCMYLAGQEINVDYKLLAKGDDFVVLCRHQLKNKHVISAFYTVFSPIFTPNSKTNFYHGLGMILKFLKIGDINDFDFCSTHCFERRDGTVRIMRQLERFISLSPYSESVTKFQNPLDRGLICYRIAEAALQWAEGLPIYDVYYRKMLSFYEKYKYHTLKMTGVAKSFILEKEEDWIHANQEISDKANAYTYAVDPYSLLKGVALNKETDYADCVEWMDQKYGISLESIQRIESAIMATENPQDTIQLDIFDDLLNSFQQTERGEKHPFDLTHILYNPLTNSTQLFETASLLDGLDHDEFKTIGRGFVQPRLSSVTQQTLYGQIVHLDYDGEDERYVESYHHIIRPTFKSHGFHYMPANVVSDMTSCK